MKLPLLFITKIKLLTNKFYLAVKLKFKIRDKFFIPVSNRTIFLKKQKLKKNKILIKIIFFFH